MHQAPSPDFTKDTAGFPALSGKLQFGKPPVPAFGLTQRQSFGLAPLSKTSLTGRLNTVGHARQAFRHAATKPLRRGGQRGGCGPAAAIHLAADRPAAGRINPSRDAWSGR